MTGDGNYISIATVQGDFPLATKITEANYPTTAISLNIAEAENTVEVLLAPLGYSRGDMLGAPLVTSLCLLYCRYAVIRDIFQGIAPSEGKEQVWQKFLDTFNTRIEALTDPEKPLAQLVDINGAIIQKTNSDKRYEVLTTTPEVKRVVTMDKPVTWNIDKSNSDESVVGER